MSVTTLSRRRLPTGDSPVNVTPVSRVFRDSLCHEVVMHTQVRLWSSLLHRVSGSPLCLQRGFFTESMPKLAAFKRVRGPHKLLILPLAAGASSGVLDDCASTLEKYMSLTRVIASRASPALTLTLASTSLSRPTRVPLNVSTEHGGEPT